MTVEPKNTAAQAYVVVTAPAVYAEEFEAVRDAVLATGAFIARPRTLGLTPFTAVEFPVVGASIEALRDAVAPLTADQLIDVAVVPAELHTAGRKLVVLDVDSTLIQQETIDLLAARAGTGEEVARITAAAMGGEIEFAESLRRRVATLAGLDASVLDEVRSEIVLTDGAHALCRTLLAEGAVIGVVSGGFVEVVSPLAAELGIAHVSANTLEVVDGKLTGKLVGAIVDRAGKAAALKEFAEAEGIPLSDTVAVGDGANDLDMLAAAGFGIAFNAKPVVREQADAALGVTDLVAVLHVLGLAPLRVG